MLIYVINYGKVLDWMASAKLCAYIVISPILIALFIWIQHHSKNPYVSLAPLFQPKAIIGYFYMMLVMFFSTSTTLLTNYLSIILKVDSTHTYSLYIFLLPGYVIGAFICFWWFRWQRWRFRFLIAGGMSCFVIFFGVLYFGIAPNSTYEMLYLPIFFRGLGMLTLIIAFALFAVEDLNPEVFVVECFLSDNLPFGTGTYHGYFFLQQYAVSSATEIYIFFVGDYHDCRPAGCVPLYSISE